MLKIIEFTVDNFPIFDRMASNVFIAADSNHGYKLLAVGREIASVLIGDHSTLLAPFNYHRYPLYEQLITDY